jgi:hypothetical protein
MVKIKSKKTIDKEMLEIWKKRVKERDHFKCQICGKKLEPKNCHAHHIIPRQIRGLRWDVNNGITLCYNHHKIGIYSPHQNALWFYGWMNANKPEQLKYCIQKLKELGAKNESSINPTE